MKKVFLLMLVWIPSIVYAASFPVVCHNELSSWIKASKTISIVDIQDPSEFREHNYEGSLATGNVPARLNKVARRLAASRSKVIVVSADGGADAEKASELLVKGGVRRSRILVLEGGMEAAVKNADCDCCKPAALSGAAQKGAELKDVAQ